jgi:hypothetical protein
LKPVADVRAFITDLPEHANDGKLDPEHIAAGSLFADSKKNLLGLLHGATSDLNFADSVAKRHADSVIQAIDQSDSAVDRIKKSSSDTMAMSSARDSSEIGPSTLPGTSARVTVDSVVTALKTIELISLSSSQKLATHSMYNRNYTAGEYWS